MPTTTLLHGTYGLQFATQLPCEMGRCRNVRCFEIWAGDSPHWDKALRLMPGAEVQGMIEDCIHVDGDAEPEVAAMYDDLEPIEEVDVAWPEWECELRFGTTVFRTKIAARNRAELEVMLEDIGGLRPAGSPPLTWWEQIKLQAKYYWRRRPVLQSRDPFASIPSQEPEHA